MGQQFGAWGLSDTTEAPLRSVTSSFGLEFGLGGRRGGRKAAILVHRIPSARQAGAPPDTCLGVAAAVSGSLAVTGRPPRAACG